MKEERFALENSENKDKKLLFAIIFAIFGMLLFIALALTLPQASSSVPR
jgi:hypothetical protein